jgi:hypothetical protein
MENEAPPVIKSRLEAMIETMPDRRTFSGDTWGHDRKTGISSHGEDSIYSLTPQRGKKGLSSVVNLLVRKGYGRLSSLAPLTETQALSIAGPQAGQNTKDLIIAFREEALKKKD